MVSNQNISNFPRVLCFGEALIDRLGSIGEDHFRNSQDYFGGAPANVACGLARLGIEVAFLGKLGDDKIGNSFKELMFNRGINVDCLEIDKLLPSRVVLVRRDLSGERFFEGFSGNQGSGFADEAISLNLISRYWPSLIREATWLLIGTIPFAFKESSETLKWCIKNSNFKGIKIALDVNWRAVFWNAQVNPNKGPTVMEKESIRPLLEAASLIKLSKEEAIWFFNTNDPSSISDALPNRPDIVVTDGPNQILWFLEGVNGKTNPLNSISVVDTTGAGDAFTSGLLFKLLDQSKSLHSTEEELNEIILFAAACGSIVCSAPGAIDSQPQRNQVEDFLKEIGG